MVRDKQAKRAGGLKVCSMKSSLLVNQVLYITNTKYHAKDIEYAAAMTVVEGCLTPWPKFTHHKPERESNTERNRRKKNKKRTNKFNMKHSK